MMPVAEIELFVFLLFAVAVLAGLGLRSGVPYPVALVLGGLVIGLVPGLPSPELDPDIVFFVFLPPLLYAAAITVSAHELRGNWAPITLLAVGLVLVTIGAVAAVANAVLGVPWAAAFVLGAVLGPTDPVSAAAVLDRLGVTGRTKTILQGESLVNDGTALTAYKIAIAAVGGTAGSVAGDRRWSSSRSPRAGSRSASPPAGSSPTCGGSSPTRRWTSTLSMMTPFVAYVPAEEVGASGVLATVAAGLYVGSRSLDIIEPGTRLRTLAFWDSAAFLLDGLLFLLIGVQVPTILDRIEDADAATLTGYALLISAVVMGMRFLWMLIVPAVLPSKTSRAERIAIAWSGMRGGVSLAAALAITDEDFPRPRPRDLRRLRRDRAHARRARASRSRRWCAGSGWWRPRSTGARDAEARLRITEAALERLDELADDAPEHVVAAAARPLRLARGAPRGARGGRPRRAGPDRRRPSPGRLMAEMIDAERDVLKKMRSERAFHAEILREIERELDLDECRLRARIRL